MIFKSDIFEIVQVGERSIVVKGVARLFYEDGFPLSLAIDEFKSRGMEVSLYHVADQCWNNGWSPETILKKFRGECDIDINKSMSGIDWPNLERFCSLIDQPQRSNGGYEKSREMIFEYLFGISPSEVFLDRNSKPVNWLNKVVEYAKENEKQETGKNSRRNSSRNKRKSRESVE